jgi:hypothetical protein
VHERLALEQPGPQPTAQQLQHAPVGDPLAQQQVKDLRIEHIESA